MGQRLALLIGNSYYNDSNLSHLKSPQTNVSTLADLLSQPKIGNYKVDVINDLDYGEVDAKIRRFFDAGKKDDTLVFYFVGHGIRDYSGRLHLTVKNSEITDSDGYITNGAN